MTLPPGLIFCSKLYLRMKSKQKEGPGEGAGSSIVTLKHERIDLFLDRSKMSVLGVLDIS